MNQINANHKGILLWVDDNFIDKPFEKDVIEWERIFGNESDHIYRLMDLHLRFATTLDTGEKAINELDDLDKQGVYVFCIIDLKLPKNRKTRDFTDSEHGMSLAKLATEKGFTCVFLTTESNRSKEQLAEKRLATIPFYSKEQNEQVIPGPLVQHILSNFRSHISWISIEEIYNALNKEWSLFGDNFKRNKSNLSIKYFPFVNVFRAFVERWEYLPIPEKRAVTIFRSPKNHSDAFIQQCLLVTLNNLVQDRPDYVSFRYTSTAFPQYSDHLKYAPKGLTVNAIRIDTTETNPSDFYELLKQVKTSKLNHITYFVLPNDESSDEYIEKATRFRNINFEDLPTIRLGDFFTRQSIIRSAVNLVFQHVKISTGQREKKRLADIYLAQPEVLMKPLTWVMNHESEQVADKLSDPFEILNEIEKSARKLQGDQMSAKTLQKLINGEPVEISNLLEFGTDILREDRNIDFKKSLQEDWLPKALKMWLSKSWQFPYGMEKEIIQTQNQKNNKGDELEEKWEDFSLDVLIDLVDSYKMENGPDELNAVCRFIKHPVISDLLKGKEKELDDENWAELLTVKWPHYQYPMPVALNKKLKKAGRYLWVETDHFNLTRVFPSTRLRHRHLDDVIILIGQQLQWIESQCKHLPYEWAVYIKKFIQLIVDDQIKSTWKSKEGRKRLYDDLVDFLDNVLPLSFMACSILGGKLSGDKEVVDKFYEDHKGKLTFGTLMEIIRGGRRENPFTHIRPSEKWFFSSRNKAYDFFNSYSLVKTDYCARVIKESLIEELTRENLLQKISKQLDPDKQKKLMEITGKKNLHFSKQDLKGLDSRAIKEMLDLLRGTGELEEVLNSCEKNDINEMVAGFIKRILDYNRLERNKKGDDSFKKIMDGITQINEDVSDMFKEIKEPASGRIFFGKSELSTFFSSPFDVIELSLNAYEKLSMTLQRLSYVDGYHFLNMIGWLRNKQKGAPPPVEPEVIEFVFELFSFGIEALIAQLKFLLELTGESQRAENIRLKYVEKIEMPKHLEPPKPEDLKSFYEVGKSPEGDGYSLYHLGVSGTEGKVQKGIMLHNEFVGLDKNKGLFDELP
jgi:hypothetical protein